MTGRKDSEKLRRSNLQQQFGEAMTTDSAGLKPARVAVLARGFLRAQAPGAGAIAGTVTDPSGAVVATPEGGFRLSLPPPGNDSMAVEQEGCKPPTLRSIHDAVSATAIDNVRLETGRDAVKIEVPGSAQLAETGSSAGGWVTDQSWIVDLPLANRNFTQIEAEQRFCGRE
jgi:hypothetical protein